MNLLEEIRKIDSQFVIVAYNDKLVSMDYIGNPKDQFKFGCMRIQDNLCTGNIGYIKDINGKIYQIERGKRKAKLIK